MSKKEEMYSSWQGDSELQSKKVTNTQEIEKIEINQLKGFKNHPFKVEINRELFELMQSIERDGILVPLLARPSPDGNEYELISGHRRKAACEWAGITEVPVIICDMDDNQATIAMVNSNLQREHVKPSEKAFAYKMKLDAMNRQGTRTDLTSGQLVQKLEDKNSTLVLAQVECGIGDDGYWGVNNAEGSEKIDSNKELAMQFGESERQIRRFIRLTSLIPKILDMVDEEKIAFTVAVELSYLKEEEQYELHAAMELEQCTPSLSQANRMKRMSQSDKLDITSCIFVYVIPCTRIVITSCSYGQAFLASDSRNDLEVLFDKNKALKPKAAAITTHNLFHTKSKEKGCSYTYIALNPNLFIQSINNFFCDR